MWQRFTERARRAILTAQEEAGLLQSREVTTSHLLLALLTDTDSPAGLFLQATGLSANAVRQTLASQALATSADSHLSQEMKDLLTDSAKIAKELGHHDIDSHHLLLALLHPECGLAPLFKKLDLSPEEMRGQILEYLG